MEKTVSSAWEMCNIYVVAFPFSSYYVVIFRWPIVAAQKFCFLCKQFFVHLNHKKNYDQD